MKIKIEKSFVYKYSYNSDHIKPMFYMYFVKNNKATLVTCSKSLSTLEYAISKQISYKTI